MSAAAHPPRPAADAVSKWPGATYRLQFNGSFGFAAAAAIVPYLRELGITHCYASPIFEAPAGSTHGYDVCNFDRINPALGAPQEFELFLAALKTNRLGLILDMVPNHMGNDLKNAWWRDVLEWGPQSRFANYFDIDWESPNPAESPPDSKPKVLLPILEDHFATVLEAGKFQLSLSGGLFVIGYHDRRLPLAPSSYGLLLSAIAEWLGQNDPAGDLRERVAGLTHGIEQAAERADPDNLHALQQQLQQLEGKSKRFRAATEAALGQFNGTIGQPASFDRLHQLLLGQNYRLAFWRIGSEELNYRRFFDVTELVSLKMELPEVFRDSHCFVFKLLADEQVSGLRIDHPDGLWDPKGYFDRLQESYARIRSLPADAATADNKPLYVVAEKILSDDEPIPGDWAIHGTTGYEFLNVLNGLFVDSSNEPHFNRVYREFSGKDKTFAATVYASKKRVLEKSLISEVNALTRRLKAIADRSRYSQDFTSAHLRRVLTEVIVCFPVYRTYVTEQTREIPPCQQQYIHQAVEAARPRLSDLHLPMLDFLRDLLLLKFPRDLSDDARKSCRQFILKFQQLTGPAAAKGVEDTAFYRCHRLISLNEVGGNPARFGVSVEDFHRFNSRRAATFPHSLLGTSTHDTKRGEDVRATINVLSEIPLEWEKALRRWRDLNVSRKQTGAPKSFPDANDQYLFYQNLIGAWPPTIETPTPDFRDRLTSYLLKAIKEAKSNTSWTEPNAAYESATKEFVEAVLDPANQEFLKDFSTFQSTVAFFGRLNSLSQLLLKITSPGVPDFYQGAELWDLNLVDPDNRRPVDYQLRQGMLAQIKRSTATPDYLRDLTDAGAQSGLIKLFATHRALRSRTEHRDLFDHGEYIPLAVEGSRKRHICAFARKSDSQIAIVVVPRLLWSLMNGRLELPSTEAIWADTRILLPFRNSSGINIFTGEEIRTDGPGALSAARALSHFPIALLLLQ